MAEIKKISTELQLLDKFLDTSGDAGTSGQVLSSTGTGINWVSASSGTITGSGTTGYIPKWTGSSALGDSILEVNSALPSSVIIPEYLRHSGDTNTYFGFQSNDTFIVATNNTERLRVDSTGYVGIGTTSPDNTLDVVASDVNITPNAESSAVFRRNGNNYLTILSNASNEGGILFGNAVDDNDGSISYKHNTQSMQFATADAERMRITSTGNVGIGTTSPSALFSVANTTVINGNGTAGWGSSANYGFLTWDGGTVNAAIVKGQNGKNLHLGANNRNNDLVITTAGNVGIGTTSPSEKLEVAGNIVGDGTLNTQGTITVGNGQVVLGGTGRIQGVDTVSASTDAANKAYVDAHGGGLGPFLPLSAGSSYPLTGDLYLKTTNDTSIAREQIIWQTSQGTNRSFIRVGGSYASNALEFGTGNSILGMILHANAGLSIGTTVATALPPASGLLVQGNVGIGTTSPGEKLEVVGNIRTNVGNGSGFMLTGSSASGLVRNNGTGLALRTNSIDKLIIDNTGSVTFSAYTGTNEQGTPTYLLGTDASGNVVKTNTVPGSAAGPYLPLAGGTMSGNTNHSDNVKDRYGTGNDFQIWHDGSNTFLSNEGEGHLNIINTGDDRDIIFKTDDGSGATTSYMVIDGSAEQTRFYKDTRHTDGIKANFGDSNDLQIYHDGSNSYIKDNGIGDLRFMASNIKFYDNGTAELMAQMIPNGAVELYYNNSKKFETTNTGVSVTGNGIFTGNVGIGTTSPGSKLEVSSGAGANGDSILTISADTDNSTSSSSPKILMLQKGSTKTSLIEMDSSNRTHFSNGDGHYFSGGNVGIGTTSPGYKLDVDGVVRGDRFFVGTNAAASQWAFHARNNNSTADSGIYFNNNSSEIYLRNSSNVIGARIRSNSASYFNGGDVGIGTASPQERLHVSGETHPSIKLSSSSDGNYNVILNCGYRNEALNLSVGGYKVFTTEGFNTPETTHLYSNNSKALSLASNQAATFTSTVTATNFINSSDERLKENIEEVRDNNVEVNWKTFNFKTKKEQKRYGVIAQELEKTNPEFVREDSQGFKSVAYIDLLIAKIAELEARIQKLEK